MGVPSAVDINDSDPPVAERRNEPFLHGDHRHTLQDWLELHGLTARQCSEILSRAKDHVIGDAPPVSRGVSAAEAWRIAAEALDAAFPGMAAQVATTRDSAVLRLDTSGIPPLTVPLRAGSTIMMHYRGRIRDLLTLAHEFGHALQITATGGKFVAPLTREICGFLAELALLTWLRDERSALHEGALAAWRADNASYLGRHAAALDTALRDPGSPYVYGWNYPIARVLASECSSQVPARTQWAVYEDRISVAGLATFLGCSRRAGPRCNRACLKFPGNLRAAGESRQGILG